MKSLTINKILLFFLIFLSIYVFYSSYLTRKETIDHIYVHIGNCLSSYFHTMGLAILEKSNFKNEEYTQNFLKYLPTEIIYEDSDMCKNIYKCFEENGVTYENSKFAWSAEWFIRDDNQMKFWICMKPLINYILDEAFKKTGINTPVDCPIIHFRCSDVPFGRQNQYHFAKYDFYKKALDDIKQKTGLQYNKVKILYSNGHLSTQEYGNACDKYCSSLKKYLEDLNYDVEVYSNTDIEDFANMFYAPATIGTVSSYSFMSGFFGNGIYITNEHIIEEEVKSECNLCKEWMYESYKLKHNSVFDYMDTENVISLLRSS